MFKFFKKLNKPPSKSEETYALEWRNRYLMARLTFLKKQIEAKGNPIDGIEKWADDLEQKNRDLQAMVSQLEQQLKSL